MPDFSVLCKEPPVKRCDACKSLVPDDDELCPDCGYFLASYDLGETPDDEANVDEDIEISTAVKRETSNVVRSSRSLAELLQHAHPRASTVYGWWDGDGQQMVAAWFSSRGWFATITRLGPDGSWEQDINAVLRGALRRMAGPFSSVRTLALSARYDDYGKLGGLPAVEAGAILWGLLRLLDERDRELVAERVKARSKHVRGRRHRPLTTELP